MSTKPEPRCTSDATLAQIRAWYDSRFAQTPESTPPPTMIVATGPTGQTILLDVTTGEVVA
jgi:hypothetical protein